VNTEKRFLTSNLRRKVVLKKLTSLTLAAALVGVLCSTSAFANNSSDLDVRTDTAAVPSGASAKKDVKPNQQLKNDMLKLVADARAGRVMPAPKSQIQPDRSNNLSKGKKIAIGVSIAVAIVAVILIVKSPILNDGQ
jgi:hypothetical protein